jgi:hypothetical protein
VIRLNTRHPGADYFTMTASAPRIDTMLLVRILEDPASVIVWLPELDLTDVAEGGLTAAQATADTIVPVMWHDGAVSLLSDNAGSYQAAAEEATRLLADQAERGLI